MLRECVSSSHIGSIGYDSGSETLEVEFLDGAIYHYYNVPENMYEEFLNSDSKGRFLNTYIKGQYSYERV